MNEDKNIFEPLNALSKYCYAISESKGFHDDDTHRGRFAEYAANLHEEVSELWSAFRASKLDEPCDKAAKMAALGIPVLTCVEEELADIIIRALDTAAGHGIDIGRAVQAKCSYNETRDRMHGKVC